MDLAQLEELLELMHRHGCVQAKVGDIHLVVDLDRAKLAPEPVTPEPPAPEVVEVTGEERPASRVNPLLRHKSLGLGPLLSTAQGEKPIAP